MRQAEKPPRLVGHVSELRQTAAFPDDIEQITMFTRCGVGPFAHGSLAGLGAGQAHEHRAPLGVAHVAHHPVAALAPPAGKIFAAHGLGLPAETMCEV